MSRFSPTLQEHSSNPRNNEPKEAPDGVGMASNRGRSPHVVFYVYVEGGVIRDARFQATGCGVAIACGSVLTEIAINKQPDECKTLDVGDIENALDGLPANKRFCAELSLHALWNALENISS